MEIIPINKNDLEFIKKLYPYFSVLIKNNNIYLKLSRSEMEKLLEKLSTKLIKEGLKLDDEPNEIGIHIESLIDLFSRYFYLNNLD